MRRGIMLGLGCVLAIVGQGLSFGQGPGGKPPELVASTEPLTPEQERAALHLPPGFEIQLVASEPEIQKPMNLAFDAKGRLWVTSSVEYPFPANAGSAGRDRVTILDDFDANGRARRFTTFASGLNIPIGVLPIRPNQALVHSIPNLYLMTDDDGDGRADRQEIAYSAIGFRDTHGMASSFTWGNDGWIYGTHGFANDSTLAGRDGESIQLNSGNTYRLRADGSHVEQWTWGQVNPFGLAFSERGDLFSADCHSRPIMMLLRGGYYPSFGKPHDGLGFAPEVMTHDHGSTGIAGICVNPSAQYPENYAGTAFIGNVVTSRINHDRFVWKGSSPSAVAEPDFVVSDDPWFRPVDIELGPDGSLFVADFYNRIIGHYEVPITHPDRDRERGRIWRIVYKGEEKHAEAVAPRSDWTAATSEELVADLDHHNAAVRTLATNELVSRGTGVEGAVRGGMKSGGRDARIQGLWILARLGVMDAAAARAAASDADPIVRVQAMRVLGEFGNVGDTAFRNLADASLLEHLKDGDAFVRRGAAEGLGRHPASGHVLPLIEAIQVADGEDTQYVHALRIALRDQIRAQGAWELVSSQDERLTPEALRILTDIAPGLHEVRSAAFVLENIKRLDFEPPDMVRFVHHVARWGDEGTDAKLVAFLESYWPENPAFRADLLREMAQGCQERGAGLPESGRQLAVALQERLLGSSNPTELTCGCNLAAALKLHEAAGPLEKLATGLDRPEGQRGEAMRALMAVDPEGATDVVGGMLRDAGAPLGLREQAANLLGQSGNEKARGVLIEALAVAPSRLQGGIAEALASSREGAQTLLEALEAGKASARILQSRGAELKLRNALGVAIEEPVARLLGSLPPADAAIQALIEERRPRFEAAAADGGRGAAVFKQHCAACHQIGGEGGRVGPQLEGIGVRGADRLMEDTLDPNRNVDQAFRSITLALDDGRVVTGLPLREEGVIVILADSKGEEVRVEKERIEERIEGNSSLMPANLAEQISESDYYDLLQFLLEHKEGGEPASPGS